MLSTRNNGQFAYLCLYELSPTVWLVEINASWNRFWLGADIVIPNGFLYSLTQTSDGGYVIGASAQIQNPFGLRVLKLPPPPSPSQIVNGIVENVQSMNLQQGIANSLDAKIQNALDSLNALNADQRSDAVNKLQAFVNSVEAQRNTKLTNEQADSLVTQAQYAISLIQG